MIQVKRVPVRRSSTVLLLSAGRGKGPRVSRNSEKYKL